MDFKSLVKSNKACSVPWTHLDITLTGKVSPCCKHRGIPSTPDKIIEMWSSDQMKILRQDFLVGEGVKLYACNKCDTDPNVRSLIHIKNEIALQMGLVDDIDLENPKLPSAATISLNNTCNLSCRMCNPLFSSRVAEIVKKSPILDSMMVYQNPEKYSIDTLDVLYPNLQFVSFLGGEPFYNKEFVTILQRLKSEAKKLKVIVVTTNMTVLNIPVLDELKTIPYTKLIISLDGPEHIHNYIRAGADYNSIIENIKYISKNYPMIKLIVSNTIGALNVGYIPEYIQAINDLQKSNDINIEMFNQNLVLDPFPLHPSSLPNQVKNMYKDKLSNFDKANHCIKNSEVLINAGLHLLNTKDDDPRRTPENFYKFVSEYDRVLKTDYRLVYPELN